MLVFYKLVFFYFLNLRIIKNQRDITYAMTYVELDWNAQDVST